MGRMDKYEGFGLVGSGRGGRRVHDGDTTSVSLPLGSEASLHSQKSRRGLALDRCRAVGSRPQRISISILILVLHCVIVTCSADI